MKYPPTIQKLIHLFSKFPSVGPKTAARFVFYLLKSKKEDIDELIITISKLRENVKTCSLCFNSFEPPFTPSFTKAIDGKKASKVMPEDTSEGRSENKNNKHFCDICSNPGRDKSLLCIVEKETDLVAIEKTKQYKGLYFVLGGVISTLRKKDLEKIRSEELKLRIENDTQIKEIIIATNPTSEGEATALYSERLLKPFDKKITRLGRGLPSGGELEYADDETLKSALESRR